MVISGDFFKNLFLSVFFFFFSLSFFLFGCAGSSPLQAFPPCDEQELFSIAV